ncbi:LysM peptidoglycan-binding domain-containing protein [Paenibacillus sp. CGMCC 1.16610]|uniref:LysM peptidoglycan-binding domain-containing protein n=2 Tax=Paenibacillus TaxID=44249 RepID=A0ABW9UFM1_9BACL|nr:LysM peptidoglycan-binding domain-containing protein [Paenibacillus sp. CGMCC 1.16610]MVQ37528.1 LysM peptidoglycan-binding domain-containing protein [Paenibacillus anseongense]
MMFLRILFTTLTIPLLVSLWLTGKAYSYPSSDEFTELPQSYSLVANTSSAVEPETTTTATVPPTTQYQVNRGDTLFKIARDFEVDVNDLMAANGISDPRGLTIGQTLNVPSSGTGAVTKTQPKIIKKVINTTLTAYTAGFESTGKKASHPMYGITFSGLKAKEGRTIAVDPAVIPLGSTVFIEGIGIRKAEDIGSAIRGSRIDVFMNDLSQAQEFGVKKNVKVYVLNRENI